MTDTTDITPDKTNPAGQGVSYLEWGPFFGGAVITGALSIVLTQFGAGIGLAASDRVGPGGSLTWGIFLIGLWLVLVAFASASAGGYVAGRMRSHFGDGTADEAEFRDGIHGIIVWALATIVIGAGMGLVAAISTIAAPAAETLSEEAMAAARNASVITGFATGAGAVLGAAGAWFAAIAGGKHRDEGISVNTFVPAIFRHRTDI